MLLKKYRNLQTFLLFFFLTGLIFSFYLQYIKNFDPCLLCLAQRAVLVILTILTLGTILVKICQRIFLGLQLSFAILGVALASRQLWLQNNIHDVANTCLPYWDVLIRYFSWQEILKTILIGSSDCGKATATWFNISLAGFSNIYFIITTIYILFLIYKLNHE